MVQTAERAGLHRTTLHRWEKDLAQPRLSELAALFSALEVSESQQRSVLHLLESPRAARMVWQEVMQIAAQAGVSFVDYYRSLVGKDGAFPSKYSNEGVHANMAGYDVMRPLAEAALRKAER